jgi:hypothetical protein
MTRDTIELGRFPEVVHGGFLLAEIAQRLDGDVDADLVAVLEAVGDRATYERQSCPGMIRHMNSSKSGTVKPVSPWLGLQTMPLEIS